MRIVAALGGNALLERGESPDAGIREAHVSSAVTALTPVLRHSQLLITHGNGPQVGVLAVESARDRALSHPYPFGVPGAQTQGMIGYWLAQALSIAIPGRQAGCLICRTAVRADDPALANPTKFIGPVCDETTAKQLSADHGWDIRMDGPAWRRVVPWAPGCGRAALASRRPGSRSGDSRRKATSPDPGATGSIRPNPSSQPCSEL